jgi:hypothetical protein
VDCDGEMEPDLMAVLCVAALRTRVVSSVGVRSAIERRCRGANGEVCGEGDEYDRDCWVFLVLRRHAMGDRRSRRTGGIVLAGVGVVCLHKKDVLGT